MFIVALNDAGDPERTITHLPHLSRTAVVVAANQGGNWQPPRLRDYSGVPSLELLRATFNGGRAAGPDTLQAIHVQRHRRHTVDDDGSRE